MKTVTYRGTNTIDGATLVCITLKKSTEDRNIAVLQCNNFHQEDIQKLKALVNKIDNQKNQ